MSTWPTTTAPVRRHREDTTGPDGAVVSGPAAGGIPGFGRQASRQTGPGETIVLSADITGGGVGQAAGGLH